MELAWLLEGCISFAFPSEKTQFVYFGMEERGQVLSYVTFICIKASIKLCCQRKCLSAGKCIPVTCAGYASNWGIPQNNSKFWFGWSISMFDAKYSHFQGPMHVLHAQQS